MKSAFLQQGIPKEDQIMSAAKQVSDKIAGEDSRDPKYQKEVGGVARHPATVKKMLIKAAQKEVDLGGARPNYADRKLAQGDVSGHNLNRLSEDFISRVNMRSTGASTESRKHRVPGGVENLRRIQKREEGIDPDDKKGGPKMKGSPAKQGVAGGGIRGKFLKTEGGKKHWSKK